MTKTSAGGGGGGGGSGARAGEARGGAARGAAGARGEGGVVGRSGDHIAGRQVRRGASTMLAMDKSHSVIVTDTSVMGLSTGMVGLKRSRAAYPRAWACSKRLKRVRWLLVAAWLLALGFWAWVAPQFPSGVTTSFAPPSGSPSDVANTLMANYFPEFKDTQDLFVLIHSPAGRSLLRPPPNNSGVAPAGDTNNSTLYKLTSEFNDQIAEFERHNSGKSVLVSSYYSTLEQGLAADAEQFLAAADSASYIKMTFPAEPTASAARPFVTAMRTAAASLGLGDTAVLDVVGVPATLVDTAVGITTRAAITHSISYIVALSFCAWFLDSRRLTGVLALELVTAVSLAFAAMSTFTTQEVAIESNAPEITAVLSAFAVLSSAVFMLNAYIQGVTQDLRSLDAVAKMLGTCSRPVLINGCVMSLACLAMSIVPLPEVRSAGISAALGVFLGVMIALCSTPVALVAGGTFFSKYLNVTHRIRRLLAANIESVAASSDKESTDGRSEAPGVAVPQGTTVSRALAQEQPDERPLWVRLVARLSQSSFRFLAVAVVLGCALPFSARVGTTEQAIGLMTRAPTMDCASVVDTVCDDQLVDLLRTTFKEDVLLPVQLVLSAPDGSADSTMLTEEFWTTATTTLGQFYDLVSKVDSVTMRSVLWQGNGTTVSGPTPYSAVAAATDPSSKTFNSPFSKSLRNGIADYVDATGKAVYAQLTIGQSPWSSGGRQWLEHARTLTTAFSETSDAGITYQLAGTAGIAVDKAEVAASYMVALCGVMTAVMVATAIVSNRSVISCIRGLITSATTTTWVVGVVAVFFASGTDHLVPTRVTGVAWTSLVTGSVIATAMAFARDLMMADFVLSERLSGAQPATGPVQSTIAKIGTAMMAMGTLGVICLAPLCASPVVASMQLGVIVLMAVVLDTFVVHTVFTPNVLSACRDVSWWPRALPKGTSLPPKLKAGRSVRLSAAAEPLLVRSEVPKTEADEEVKCSAPPYQAPTLVSVSAATSVAASSTGADSAAPGDSSSSENSSDDSSGDEDDGEKAESTAGSKTEVVASDNGDEATGAPARQAATGGALSRHSRAIASATPAKRSTSGAASAPTKRVSPEDALAALVESTRVDVLPAQGVAGGAAASADTAEPKGTARAPDANDDSDAISISSIEESSDDDATV